MLLYFLFMLTKVLLLPLITFLVYALSNKGEGSHWNYFILTADAFLHGHLNILNPPSWLNELVFWKEFYYSVFPPMPAILLMPFVALFGINFYQPILSWLLGAFSVLLSYMVFCKVFNEKVAFWTSILYAFGTIQWFHAQVGSAWYLAHITSLFFLWLFLWEAFTKHRLIILGFFLGCAYLSRLPTIFALIFILVYFSKDFFSFHRFRIEINWKNALLFLFGLIPFLLINALYNYLRYGVISDIGYTLLPIFNEPWYKFGFLNINYVPIHLAEIFTAMPIIIGIFPYIIPSMFAMAIWFTTPAFILMIFARFRTKIAIASILTIIAIAIPSLLHGGNGFSQFGYRHTLDYMPFLLLLTASGMRDMVKWWTKLLIFLSILINFWGVIMISHLNKWGI